MKKFTVLIILIIMLAVVGLFVPRGIKFPEITDDDFYRSVAETVRHMK